MMAAMLALAETAATPVSGVASREWHSMNHTFACDLRTERGQVIRIEGEAKLTAVDRNGRTVLTRGSFDVRSKDRNWRFLDEHAGTQGSIVQQEHNVHFDFSDGPIVATAKSYSLDLSFASRIGGMRGPYGYAVLRDGNDGTPFVLEAREDPVMAVGICQMIPKEGAHQ